MALRVTVVFEGVRLPISLHPEANLFELKQLLQMRTGVPPPNQKLVGFDIDDLDDVIPLDAVAWPDMTLHLEDSRGKAKAPQSPPRSSPNFRAPSHEQARNRYPPPRSRPADSGKLINVNLLTKGQAVSTQLQNFLGLCEVDTDFFVQTFETKYGYEHPPFTCGSWTSFHEAEINFKNRLVIAAIHDEENSENTYFSSLVLSRKEISKFFTEEKVPYWAGVLSTESRHEYQKVFQQAMKFPCLLLISNVKNMMNIIDIVSDLMTPVEFLKRLKSALAQHNHTLAELERIAAEQEAKRQEALAQQMAFEQSANQDRMKQEMKELADILKDSKREAIAGERQEVLEKFKALPEFVPSEQEARGINLGLRLPDGSRVNRVFSSSSKFQHVLDWVSGLVAEKLTDETFLDDESAPIESLGAEGDEEAAALIKPWTIAAFELVARGRSFTTADASSTLSELGIAPQMLLLQRKV